MLLHGEHQIELTQLCIVQNICGTALMVIAAVFQYGSITLSIYFVVSSSFVLLTHFGWLFRYQNLLANFSDTVQFAWFWKSNVSKSNIVLCCKKVYPLITFVILCGFISCETTAMFQRNGWMQAMCFFFFLLITTDMSGIKSATVMKVASNQQNVFIDFDKKNIMPEMKHSGLFFFLHKLRCNNLLGIMCFNTVFGWKMIFFSMES